MAKLLYPPSVNGLQKTLDAQLDQGETTSMTLNNATNVQNKPGLVVINRIDTNGTEKDAADREYVQFDGVSGATLTTLVRGKGGSTDQDHAVGSVVEFVNDVTQQQNLLDAIALVVDETDNTAVNTTNVVTPTATQTLTNKTLTSPKVGTAIADTNGNEIIKTPATTDAVNEFTATNAATGNSPQLSVTGDDTNIDMELAPKGSGTLKVPAGTYEANVTDDDDIPNKKYVDDNAGSTDGWIDGTAYTWVYASASSFTISGVDLTSVFQKGTRLRFKQDAGTYVYAVVTSSSFSTNTTVNIAVNTDYVIANETITANDYSYQLGPQGYPDWFNFTLVWKTGFSSDPTVDFSRFRLNGRTCEMVMECSGNGTSDSTRVEINLPITPVRTFATSIKAGYGVDNGTVQTGTLGMYINTGSGGYIQLSKTGGQNFTNWTASGSKSANIEISYEI